MESASYFACENLDWWHGVVGSQRAEHVYDADKEGRACEEDEHTHSVGSARQ